MELDHFRPKSRKEFRHLANNPLNLHYACRSCNGLKSNNWPAPGTKRTFFGVAGFIDAFEVNRSAYFFVARNGALRPLKHPAAYMATLLALDRPFLRRLRELRQLKKRLGNLQSALRHQCKLVENTTDKDAKRLAALALKLDRLVQRLVA
jgi:hypothetical protein